MNITETLLQVQDYKANKFAGLAGRYEAIIGAAIRSLESGDVEGTKEYLERKLAECEARFHEINNITIQELEISVDK